MTGKKVNWLFLTMILTHIVVVLFLVLFGSYISIGITANFFLGQAVLIAPSLLFLACNRQTAVFAPQPAQRGYDTMPRPARYENGMTPQPAQFRHSGALQPARSAAFRRMKISSFLMTALATLLIMPLVTVLNALTLFFTNNEVASIQGDILSIPFPIMFFMIGIFGPFCEEFVFRGVIYGSYADQSKAARSKMPAGSKGRAASGGMRPILLSAFLFGLMHMNFNQAVYAFAIGIFLAILVEAAGSLWASVFCHMFFNSCQVVMMYLSKAVLGNAYGEAVSETAAEMTHAQLQAGLAVYLIIAAVTTPIAGCCVAWVVKNEGRQETVRALFPASIGDKAQKNSPGIAAWREPLVTTPLIVAIVICLGYMSMEWFL